MAFKPTWDKIQQTGVDPFIAHIEGKETFRQEQVLTAQHYGELYLLIFRTCYEKRGEEDAYKQYTHIIKQYLDKVAHAALTQAMAANDGLLLLKEWVRRWQNMQLFAKGMGDLFRVLDQHYTQGTDGALRLLPQAYTLFREQVFKPWVARITDTVLTQLDLERKGSSFNSATLSLLGQVIVVSVQLSESIASDGHSHNELYKTAFEKPILEQVAKHYREQSSVWLAELSCTQYLARVFDAMDKEKIRGAYYFPVSSVLQLLSEHMYRELLQRPQQALLENGLATLLLAQDHQPLQRLFMQYNTHQKDCEVLATHFSKHVAKEGKVVMDSLMSATSLQPLIDLHMRYHTDIVVQCYQSHPLFFDALRRAFESFINDWEPLAGLLASHLHDVLITRSSTTSATDSSDSRVEHLVCLYGYLQDKDVFEQRYQSLLAQRLLTGKHMSLHAEKQVIAKLKGKAGYQWHNKLEGMFKDIETSKDLMQKYMLMREDNKQLHKMNLHVNICASGVWPNPKRAVSCQDPALSRIDADLSAACSSFTTFYIAQHGERKLSWDLNQGSAEVLVTFGTHPGKQIARTLCGTTYQMLLLLLFNRAHKWTFGHMLAALGNVPASEVAHHLLSLAHPKVCILVKRPNNKALELTHEFMINPSYTNPNLRVMIPLMPPQRSTQEDTQQERAEREAVETQRKHQIDSTIVRVMKTRKTMKHNLLLTEVTSQLKARFIPDMAQIKKRIEAMLEQEYMARDPSDRAVYTYLA